MSNVGRKVYPSLEDVAIVMDLDDDRAIFQESPDELPVIDIHSL